MKLSELVSATGVRMEGSPDDIEILGANSLDDAEPGEVTFLANRRYAGRVKGTRASAIFVSEDFESSREIILLRASDPYLAYTRALRLFHPEPTVSPSWHPSAVVDPTAQVAEDTSIGAHVVLGRNVVIGSRVRIHPNVTIYDDVEIGADCVIHSGVAIREGTEIGERVVIYNNAVIGSDGFGYAKDEQSRWLKIPQTSRVVIEDDVDVGAGTTIDRASVGETRIKRGAKIDNLVQIGHSCTVGEDALLCAQVGLSGSSHIGDRVVLLGQVGIGGHLKVGNDAILYPQSGVPSDVQPGEILCGSPAMNNKEYWRSAAVFKKLSELPRRLREIERRLAALTGKELKNERSQGKGKKNAANQFK